MSNRRENPIEELPKQPEEELDSENFEPISKQDEVSREEERAFIEMLNDIELARSSIAEDPHLAGELEKMIETLPNEKWKEVIRRRFINGESQKEVGKKLGVTHERIGVIEANALRRLMKAASRKYVKDVELQSRQ